MKDEVLTPLFYDDRKLENIENDRGMSMKGGIFSKEKCPICKKPYQHQLDDLACPGHHTRPRRFYIQLYSRQLHKHINIHSNSRGQPFASYEEADRLLTVIRNEIDSHGDFDPTKYVAEKIRPLKFSHWTKSWLAKKKLEADKGLRSPSYLKAVRVYIRKYQSYFGNIDIREIGTKSINDFYLSLDGAPHYIKSIIDCLKKMLQDALDWGDIGQIPKFPKIDVPEPDIQTIDLDKQDAIINAIPNQMDRAYILFTAREMVRPSETRALQWSDLDLTHDRVTIRRHFSLNQVRPATKAKNIKYLPLDGEVKKVLLNLPRHLTCPFVFWKRDGHPFSENWARKLWKRISSSQGINICLYQGTRHSSATEAADRAGVDATQEFLHHTNRKMTERYVNRNPERLRKVLRKSG